MAPKIFATLILTLSAVYGQSIRISEVMSDNGGIWTDEDGDSPDWIELHNTTDTAISLSGWHLSDDDSDLTQWTFPNVTIDPKAFLIVAASGKDRAVSGAQLHANFKLSSSGEYLALVQADGATIEDDAQLPSLPENAAHGYGFPSVSTTVIFDQGAPCTALIPTSNITGWQDPAFNDASWLTGTTGVGYEGATADPILYDSLIGLDVSAMEDSRTSVYIRVPFNAANQSQINGLTLKMKYDDAFVAYLNGTETTRSDKAPATLGYGSKATGSNSDSLAIQFQDFDLTPHLSSLQGTSNLLAIHGLNAVATSNDLLFLPRLEAHLAGDLDTSATGQLIIPTPGAANTSIAYTGFLEAPLVSPQRGLYDSPTPITVSHPNPPAVTRFTTDGSVPTETSPVFPASPPTISATINLRLRSFLPGSRPSPTTTNTYLFVDDVVTQPRVNTTINGQAIVTGLDSGVLAKSYQDSSGQSVTVQDGLKSIPTLSITTEDANLFDPSTGIYVNATEKWERPASVEWINPDGSPGFQIDAGLRIRGGYSRNKQFAKHSFRLFFRDEYGDDRLDYDFFGDGGITSYKKLDLRTTQAGSWASEGNSNNTLLRDICFRDSSLAMGDLGTRSAWCHIYLNGKYWGMYMTEERPEENFGADYLGGDKDDYDLVKIWRPYNNQPFGHGFWIEDPPSAGNLDAYARLHALAATGFTTNQAYFAVQGMNTNGELDPSQERLLDVDNMIDFLLGIYYAAAVDNGITWWTGQNNILNNLYALYNRENPDGFKWIQHDGEISYDRVTRRHPGSLDRTGPFTHPQLEQFRYFNPQTLHEKLSLNAEYRLKFADRVNKHLKNNGALVLENSETRLDARAAQIDRAVVAHSARWGNASLDRDSWVTAVDSQRDFLARSGDRSDEVIGYLTSDGLIPSTSPPILSHFEGSIPHLSPVSLSTTSGSIYFTTDGSDPRAIGGRINGQLYFEEFIVDHPIHIKARTLNTGEWSALTEATFWPPNLPLAITEVMYNAPNGSQHEFIEILNTSSHPIDLRGYKIDNAVELELDTNLTTLAPGEYLVAVENLTSFSSLYPTAGINIAGEYERSLSNSGERIDLTFNCITLISAQYNDARNWPQAADGAGHSLVPLNLQNQASGSLDYGGNWRPSTEANGSPGEADPSQSPTIVLNEIIAHTSTGLAEPFDSNDQIELFNPTSSDITLNGWSLSDDPDNLQKWAIPNGTIVPSFGFLNFDEDDFHPGRIFGFGLNKDGESLFLSSPLGIVDAIQFKGQALGSSLGRYPDGSPNWILTNPTPNSPNQVSSSIQITELMYSPLPPANSAFDYLKLTNVSASPVTLESSTGPFRIDGGISFTFPPGTTLSPGQTIWLLQIDPSNTSHLNSFATHYGLNVTQETFFGPYEKSLSDTGERVSLESPQNPDDPLDISWIVIDELFYFNQVPWPAGANGTGLPLVRTGLTTWGVVTPADADGDGMPDSWEILHFGNTAQTDTDWDQDGQSNLMEYIADTDPTDPASLLSLSIDNNGQLLSWDAKVGRIYTIYWSPDLSQPFIALSSGLTASEFTETRNNLGRTSFYRLGVELQ